MHRLTLPELSNLETDGFTDENDIFNYHEFGEGLVNMVSKIKGPLVITLDGPWGSGKSVFIKQWVGLIRKEYGESVVYFDAFANDFHSNAFLALASEIYSRANKTIGKKDPSSKEFLEKANKVVGVLASKGTDIALRLGTAGNVNLKDIEDVVKALENESKKSISEQLQKADEERASFKAFRDSLSSVSKSIAEKNQNAGQSLPLIFIVDELDRCRPPFALEILERIKHLFSVENVCFVLVTNLAHLGTSVKKAYGMEIDDAHTYLEKFYHHRIMLPERSSDDQKQRDKYLPYLWKNLGFKFEDGRYGELVREEIRFLANAHELSLRQIERVMTNVVFAAAAANEKQFFISPVVAGLCIMRQRHPDLYARARQNILTLEDVHQFLKIDGDDYDSRESLAGGRKWALVWWRYFIDPELSTEIIDKLSSGGWYNLIGERLSLLPTLTNYIDHLPTSPSHSS